MSRAPEVVRAAGGVGEKVPERDVAACRPRLRIAVGVKAFEHHRIREFGEYGLDGCVQRQLAAFDLLHGAGARDRLGHRSDPNDRVRRHRLSRGERALAVAALKDRAISRRSRGDNAGHVARNRRPASALPQYCWCSPFAFLPSCLAGFGAGSRSDPVDFRSPRQLRDAVRCEPRQPHDGLWREMGTCLLSIAGGALAETFSIRRLR